MAEPAQGKLRTSAQEFAEHTTEAACACAVLMVQGQLLLLTAAHWVVAIQTGLVSGSIATILIVVARITRPWMVSVAVGSITMIADYVVHSRATSPAFVEALLTGLVAAALAYVVTAFVRRLARLRLRRQSAGIGRR